MAKKIVTADGEITDAPEFDIPADVIIHSGPITWKTPFNHNTSVEALRTGTANNLPTMTQQHALDECDINHILKRFGIHGPEELAPPPPTFYDAPEVTTMADAIAIVRQGQDSFDRLPADIRYMFQNDLARYSAFVDGRLEAGDRDTLRKLGIDVPEPPTAAEPPAAGAGAPPPPKTAT